MAGSLPLGYQATSPAGKPQRVNLSGLRGGMVVLTGVAPAAEQQTCELLIQLQPRTVLVDDGLTPLGARTRSLEAVCAALELAGVDYFAVRGLDDRTPVVGVCEDDRPAVLAALHRACKALPGYVSTVVPAPARADELLPGAAKASWRAVAEAGTLRVTWLRTDPTRQLLLGQAYGCDVEFWRRDADRDRLVAPRPNRVSRVVPAGGERVLAPGDRFTRLVPMGGTVLPPVRTRPDFTVHLPEEVDFPIDVVYTWVDGSDPEWLARRAAFAGDGAYHAEAASAARYINRDELRYSLRSLNLNAPWVRTVYLVTDDQRPDWLDDSHPRIRVVSHREIFADPGVLPTYNSFAIETQLHHIEGLSEHFLYLNDDMFLGHPLAPQTFFLANGTAKFFYSQTRIPQGPVTADDTPIDATVKNNRAIIEACFGRTITQGFQHVPYALRRSVLAELEERFPAEHRVTMASRFRGMDNISTTYSLHHYYAFHTGRALPGTLRYGYVHLAVPDLDQRLARALARRDWDAFCLNDSFSSDAEVEAQNEILRPFLEAYFPVPSPYEKP
jgi:Stealth protein CR2, conserved region 2/Stealth protein CR3, conserved region 3/Stealth protein CR1, conserved region 1/Stealth protein CR4, conserved region 4